MKAGQTFNDVDDDVSGGHLEKNKSEQKLALLGQRSTRKRRDSTTEMIRVCYTFIQTFALHYCYSTGW